MESRQEIESMHACERDRFILRVYMREREGERERFR
jgi:hypothetical protein